MVSVGRLVCTMIRWVGVIVKYTVDRERLFSAPIGRPARVNCTLLPLSLCQCPNKVIAGVAEKAGNCRSFRSSNSRSDRYFIGSEDSKSALVGKTLLLALLMRKLLLVLLLAVLACGYWLYTGPQRTLEAIKTAADTNDIVAFRELVDVPTVKGDMLAQLLGPPDPNAGPILVNGLTMLGLNQTATPRGLQPYLCNYRAPVLGLWGGQGGTGRYATADHYLFTTETSSVGSPGSTLVLQRQGLRWRLVSVKVPTQEISVPTTTNP